MLVTFLVLNAEFDAGVTVYVCLLARAAEFVPAAAAQERGWSHANNSTVPPEAPVPLKLAHRFICGK